MSEETTYDQVPYPINSFAQTHPNILEAIGTLFGMTPKPTTNCRVLEIGCASGGNILPMAEQLPQSSFVGIDLSATQIENARKLKEAAELTNVELKQMNILDFDEDQGKFDYIISHGIYSWVPDEVKDKILSICKANLAENGIAYVSYNTFPGWRLKGMLRDMMLFHTAQFQDPTEKVTQAKALTKFLAEAVEGEDTAYSKFLSNELESIKKYKDNYIFHDALEVINDPCYFHEFVTKAMKKDLKYLGEAGIGSMLAQLMKKEIASTLSRITNNIIAREQYMDFVRNRQFRQTLLCHKKVPIERNLNVEMLRNYKIRSRIKPVSEIPVLTDGVEEEFKNQNGASFKATNPLVKAFLQELSSADPEYLPFENALERANRLAADHMDLSDAEQVESNLLMLAFRLYCEQMVDFSIHPISCVTIPSDKPEVSKLARIQAANGLPITNRYHHTVSFDLLGFKFAQLADGTRDREAIIDALVKEAQTDSLNISQSGKMITDVETLEKIIRFRVEQLLHSFAANALLLN